MKKRLITIFLAILLICTLCVTIVACNNNSVYLTYTKDDGTYSVKANPYAVIPENVVIPSTYKDRAVTSIESRAFYDCDSITSITIPDSVTSIGWEAFDNCDSLSSLNYLGTIEQWCGITFGKNEVDSLNNGLKLYINGELVEKDLIIPDTVTEINDYAFSYCTSLSNVTIPDSVTSMGRYAFAGCPIEYASIPTLAISSISKSNLKEVVITSGDSIGDKAFYNCDSLTSVTIPDSVTSMGDDAFANCTSLSSVTIGSSVTSIGEEAFSSCYSLNSVNYLGTIEQWCGITFGGYYGGGNPLYNGAKLYLNGELVEDLVIPNTVTKIKDYAFYGCTSITSVTIPDSVTSIGEDAFYKCPIEQASIPTLAISSISKSKLKEVVITGGDSIGFEAFCGCTSLCSVTIPDTVTRIGSYAFYECKTLTSVTIPDSVTSIGIGAFNSCNSLSTVYYNGTEEEWSGISIGSNNSKLTGATRYYYSETEPTTSGNYWHYGDDDGVPTPW